jgi:hypothetical protein
VVVDPVAPRLHHRGVALQVAFERRTLKPVFSLDRLQVMGFKGYRLWAMGHLDSNVQIPTAMLRQWLPSSADRATVSFPRARVSSLYASATL